VFAVVRPGERLCDRPYRPGHDLDQTLRMGFVYEGTVRNPRQRKPISDRVATQRLVYSIQNHDFIGNHPLGQRLHQLTSTDTQKAAAALMILSPAIPMLFMGEEFACPQPFRFFVDFGDPALRRAVVEGRRAEYPQHDWSHGLSPIDPQAFDSSRIGRAEAGDPAMRAWYRELIALRKRGRSAGWLRDEHVEVHCKPEDGLYQLAYHRGDETIIVAVRLLPEAATGPPLSLGIDGELWLDSRPGQADPGTILPNHAVVLRRRPWSGADQGP
jgi:1,4-alpha-glucan branching enzyme